MAVFAEQAALSLASPGVQMFILLSAFSLSLSRETFSTISFFKRRFIKILIPYYLLVTFAFVINLLDPRFYPGDGLFAYLGHIFWYKMFFESIDSSFGGMMWFMSLLIQLYLLYPLLYYVKKRLNNNLIFFLGSLGISCAYWILISALGATEIRTVNSTALKWLWAFCGAMVLADLYRNKGYRFWQQKTIVLIPVFVVGYALYAFMALKTGPFGKLCGEIPALAGFTAATILMYQGCKRLGVHLIKFMGYLGGIAFELYLTHAIILQAATLAYGRHLLYPWTPLLITCALLIPAAHLYKIICSKLLARLQPAAFAA